VTDDESTLGAGEVPAAASDPSHAELLSDENIRAAIGVARTRLATSRRFNAWLVAIGGSVLAAVAAGFVLVSSDGAGKHGIALLGWGIVVGPCLLIPGVWNGLNVWRGIKLVNTSKPALYTASTESVEAGAYGRRRTVAVLMLFDPTSHACAGVLYATPQNRWLHLDSNEPVFVWGTPDPGVTVVVVSLTEQIGFCGRIRLVVDPRITKMVERNSAEH
jgi:hypothetical protein